MFSKRAICFVTALVLVSISVIHAYAADVTVFPAPADYPLSHDFSVTIDGQTSPVYIARVGPADEQRRWKAMDDYKLSDQMFDPASFTSFDFAGQVTVKIDCPDEIKSVKVLPTSAGIMAWVAGKSLSFPLSHPANLTIEVNGQWCSSLHLFANPLQTDVPKPTDPNVIYFGPGVHQIAKQGIEVGSGKTLYIAGGAVLAASGWGGPIISLNGDHIRVCGRGIVDGSASPLHSRSILTVHGNDIQINGIILHDSPGWTMPIRQSKKVSVSNVKLFSHRANGDGIDICNSQDVTVDGCFVRTLDDCIVLKTDHLEGLERHVIVRNCVLWNQVAHALSVGAELREPVDDVLFTDCDVIHDIGREWTLRIYHCDNAPITNVRFENIRIEQCRRLISLWIGQAQWSKDAQRGHIADVIFRNITATGDPATVSLLGFDKNHAIDKVLFDHVQVNGRPLDKAAVKENEFVSDVQIKP